MGQRVPSSPMKNDLKIILSNIKLLHPTKMYYFNLQDCYIQF